MSPSEESTRVRVGTLETGLSGFRASLINGPDVSLLKLAGLPALADFEDRIWESTNWRGLLDSLGSATVIEEEEFEGGPGASDTFYRVEVDDPTGFIASLRQAMLERISASIRQEWRSRRRQPAAERAALQRVGVSVSWGYLVYSCPLSLRTFANVLDGEPVVIRQWYSYEGRRYLGHWNFNRGEPSGLTVESDDGELWIGSLFDAVIAVRSRG